MRVESLLLPARSPNLNAHLERFNRSLKEECLDRMIFFGEASLRNAVREFLFHYHGERNHQGMGNRILVPGDEVGRTFGNVECAGRLGGLLRYYHRKAA
jgi:transposase InsO family protein